MKKALILIVICCSLVGGGVLAKTYMDRGEFMSVETAKKKWGNAIFDAAKFKSGDEKQRAAMVASMIENKQMIGKSISELSLIIGEFNGHYWSDSIPAYLINEGWKNDEDTWQLVFFLDRKHKVKEVRIHKNCCDRK